MAQRDPAPEFGKWESDVRYTAYFERTGKADKSISDSTIMASQANAKSTHMTRRSITMPNPAAVVCRTTYQEGPKATRGQHPARTEQQTRADVGILRRMTNNSFHRHRGAVHQRVGTNRADYAYDVQSNSNRPRVGGGAVHPPPWERNNSTGNVSRTGIMSPSAPGRSRLRALAEGERTPGHRAGIPKFGEWNDGPSTQRFTEVFDQLRDQKKRGTSSMAATEATMTPSLSGESFVSARRPKGCWQLWCSSW